MHPDARFDKAVKLVLRHEGGYVNDPRDPGGETKFGICKRSFPQLNIRELTRSDAIRIYRREWWIRHNLEHIENDTVATKVFDIAVNVGPMRAARMLQKAANREGKSLRIDGVIGPKTLAAANGCTPERLLVRFLEEAYRHYERLGRAKPYFLKGWMKRLWGV